MTQNNDKDKHMSNHNGTAPAPITCQFSALDTWFFREARPHGSVGNSELGSVFPPPVRTLLGALRTLVGDSWFAQNSGSDHSGDHWRSFAAQDTHPLRALIGFGDDLGPLKARGPFLRLNDQRLYPAPANLMVKEHDGRHHYFVLDLGAPVHCDLGRVHLPTFPAQVSGLPELAGSKPAEGCWLTEKGLRAVLQGQAPSASEVVAQSSLYTQESRLGIGRDNQRSAVQEGLLYQTRHLRLQPGVAVELELHGLAQPTLLPAHATLRLGGEGRMAGLHTQAGVRALPQENLPAKAAAFALYALTPMPCVPDLPAGIPAGFESVKHRTQAGDVDVWDGQLAGLHLRILSVACARPLREGGWDMAQHQARPVSSLLAPGSVLYVQPLGADFRPQALQQALQQLTDTNGRSLFVAGRLPTHSTFQG